MRPWPSHEGLELIKPTGEMLIVDGMAHSGKEEQAKLSKVQHRKNLSGKGLPAQSFVIHCLHVHGEDGKHSDSRSDLLKNRQPNKYK